MSTIKTVLGVAAAASLALGSVAHAKGSASVNMLPQSSFAERASAPAAETNEVIGRGSGWILALLGVALFIGGALVLGDGDDKADSPA
ncbi:hypothetical protein [Croceicoccus sp. BE223]|uniref:hypothetical protein n=1 Tax=Croceicoccus sp. BE223 TaxID=2817716 RepID=UPI002857FC76|nr:hypothetical protein [Croceicoccus sp. BE223]MDR7102066.1 hypothetical protein [Croceicoccus sp. BE223]